MNIQHLHEFVCLARNLSFTSAAKECFISQPVLSRHVNAMEAELGVKLFIRGRQRIRLTKQGEALLPRAEQILGIYEEAVSEIVRKQKGAVEEVRVGYLYGAARTSLAPAYSDFLAHNEHAVLRLQVYEHDELVAALENNEVDIALNMVFTPPNASWYSWWRMYADHHMILVGESSHLARAERLSVADLEGETVIIPSSQRFRSYRAFIMHALELHAPGLDVLDEVNDAADYGTLVEARGYVAIIPSHLRYISEGSAVQAIPLNDAELGFDVCALWKKSNESSTLAEFMESLKRTVSAMSTAQLRGA